MAKILVTGCAGFIGSHLSESLLLDGHDVTGIDCFNDNYARRQKLVNLHLCQDYDSFEFVPIDLSRGDLRELLDGVDEVFHLAAEPGVRSSWGSRFERYTQNNVVATQQLLEAARALPSQPRIVYASSSSIYGDAETLPTPVDATPGPMSPYGVTKLAGEHLMRLYHANYGLETVSLRYFTVFGPRQRPDMAFHIFCRAALDGTPLTIFGDGLQSRDFTYVHDVVDATKAAATAAGVAGQVFNVGGGARTTLREVLDLIGEYAGRELDVQYQSSEHGDVRHTSADTASTRLALGFDPQVSLADGLRAEFEWLQSAIAA